MNLIIYQAFYQQNQRQFLDPEFEPLDNTENLFPEKREHPIFLKCRDLAEQKQIDYWGYLSWKWKEKLPGLSASDLIKIINDNKGYDVYFFNPYPLLSVGSVNVWEQGIQTHFHLLTLMEHIYPIMGIDPKFVYQFTHPDTAYFGLYTVGNKKFWNGFFNFIEHYKYGLTKIPKSILDLHESSANYREDPGLGYFPFIHERLLSSYMSFNFDRLKIYAYHHNKDQYGYLYDKLYFLKTSAIKYKDSTIVNEWYNERTKHNWPFNFAKFWPVVF